MGKIRDRIRKSYFIVNKLYYLILFLFLTITDFSLGFYYFLLSLIIFGYKTLRSKIPIEVDKDFKPETFVYKELKDRNLKLDLWLPSNKKKYPVVFFCHGGGWISGFRNQPNNVSWCKYLASKNLAVVSIDYRYGYKNTMEDILSDYSDALEFVKKNHEALSIDKDRIVLMGLSAGGHLSLLYSTYYTKTGNSEKMEGIKGVVAYYAPSDLRDIFIADNKSIFSRFATRKTLKADPEEKEDIYRYYSPITYVSKNMIPCLLVHGREDQVVPFNSSIKFAEKLKEYNIKYRFLVHKKGEHSFDTRRKDLSTVNILEGTLRFIKSLVE
ncbi:MAG TPA: alpha/beta hydrolase [Tissierellia bacterium]|nr:alpha/beta hydrolase [Tissierellia bacterium]